MVGFQVNPGKVLKLASLLQAASVPLLVVAALLIGMAFCFGVGRLKKRFGHPVGEGLLGMGFFLQVLSVSGWWLPYLFKK